MSITSKKDSLPYIGETSKTAEKKFVGHLKTILQECHRNTNTPVGQHFRVPGVYILHESSLMAGGTIRQ